MRLTPSRFLSAALLCGALLLLLPPGARAQDDATDPGSEAFYNGDYTAAMDAWRPKADGGDPEAMTNVGNLYELGLGVKRDAKQAAQWYERAAQLGFVLAQYDLANLYYDGRGVERDRKQAARWYTAAAQGGHAKSQLYLAQMYEDGDGVAENHETALSWYQKAADQELPEAQYELGRKLVYGDGVTQDGAKGSDLLLKSAEQGYPKAQMLMADCYWRGRGVPKNLIEAYVWASQAVDNPKNKKGKDAAKATNLLDDIKSGMNGDQLKAAEIELKAVAPKKQDKSGGANDAGGNGGGTEAPQ